MHVRRSVLIGRRIHSSIGHRRRRGVRVLPGHWVVMMHWGICCDSCCCGGSSCISSHWWRRNQCCRSCIIVWTAIGWWEEAGCCRRGGIGCQMIADATVVIGISTGRNRGYSRGFNTNHRVVWLLRMICIRSSLRFCCCGPFFGHYLVRCFHKFCIILLQENTNGEKRKEEIGVEDPSFACFSADVVCSCTLTISFPDFLFVCFCFFFLSDLMSSFWLFRKLWNTGNDSFSLFSICPSFLSFDTKVFLIPLFF
mmetsp:Transcript_32505/g.36983  ORF Transcript_32505/g.36983 Transcript_32505/m.36983 type:complete len:253 (-) Transcript_32505:420-1178(-)